MNKLKPQDLKLLAYLYQHNREPLTKIAKALHLSREQVDYKLNQFEKEKLIKDYLPIVSYSRLGYHSMILVFVKTHFASQIYELKNILKQNTNRITTVELLSKYDLGFVMVFKNDKDKNENIMEILETNREKISDYLIIEPYHMKFYPLKFTGSKQENEYLWIDYRKDEALLDEKEKKILSLLNKDARMKIIDIAKKTNLSAELIVYKMKRLKNEGIFLGTRTRLDMQKLGYFYTLLQINIKNLSQKLSERLENFAKNSNHIETFYLSITKPNCYMQIFHKDINELQKTIEDLKEKFRDEEFSIDLIPLKNEGEDINILPFLNFSI